MRKFLNLIVLLCISMTSCTSQKKLQSETPFETGKASCQEWVSGRETNGSGTELKTLMSFSDTSTIEVKEVYFRGKQVKTTLTSSEDYYVVAKILNSNEEYSETIDFEFKPDEAVLSYVEHEEIKYIKNTGVKEN
ncbi:hypothetical protein [Maribacter sp. ACAM166]|uniref:hypothetical protein n=1 Tax=Maribacter sp. ACAM166 TaxID=2508996 RepID=UPI0010FD2DEE|nr:hypothetical protein [Maribacter sp. ACAM166]TLP80790.1 hypothetical protein ES765_06970 [Maribacter sp. ACAM166]